MRRLVLMVLAMALLLAGAAAESASKETAEPVVPVLALPALETGSIREIPIDEDLRKNAAPIREENYLYTDDSGNPTGYADPSITVNIGRGRIYETDYMYARVKIADASQLRTLMNSPTITSNDTNYAATLARRVQAVVAINGDFYGGLDVSRGAIMRQGRLFRLNTNENTDILAVDRNGDFHILKNATDEDVESIQDQAVNIFTFGPALVIDGEPQEIASKSNYASDSPAQRMAICQTGRLEYLLITSAAYQNVGSDGLTLEQFTDLISSMPDVQQAYNLDGGSSATLVFRMDGKNWQKINAFGSPRIRPVKDIIYFCSAWTSD